MAIIMVMAVVMVVMAVMDTVSMVMAVMDNMVMALSLPKNKRVAYDCNKCNKKEERCTTSLFFLLISGRIAISFFLFLVRRYLALLLRCRGNFSFELSFCI